MSIFGVDALPVERIDFGPAAGFGIGQNEFAWFAADKWKPVSRLTIDLGLRSDWDSVTGSVHPAPRAGFALMLTKDAKTVVKGGAGLFYDRVPLNVVSFGLLPGRTVSMVAPDGEMLSSTDYANIQPAPRKPRGRGPAPNPIGRSDR